jgi:hypothetical protein
LDEDFEDIFEDAIGAIVPLAAAGAVAVVVGAAAVFLDFLTLAGLVGAMVEGAVVDWANAGAVMLSANNAARTGNARRMILNDDIVVSPEVPHPLYGWRG